MSHGIGPSHNLQSQAAMGPSSRHAGPWYGCWQVVNAKPYTLTCRAAQMRFWSGRQDSSTPCTDYSSQAQQCPCLP